MKKKFLLLIFLTSVNITLLAQYRGDKYIGIGSGIVFYGKPDGRFTIEEEASPNYQLNISFGYSFTNKLKIETALGYRRLSNDIVKADLFGFVPTLYINAFHVGKLYAYVGAGGICGYQMIKPAHKLIAFEPDDNLFIYGCSLSPRFEYLFNSHIALIADYRFEIQFNSARKMNHIANVGVALYFKNIYKPSF